MPKKKPQKLSGIGINFRKRNTMSAGLFTSLVIIRSPSSCLLADNLAGLSHLAIPYYERALKISDEHLSAIPGAWDVKYEAAYNLQQIYATSGNPLLAREVTSKYLVL